MRERFAGVLPPIVTPFNADGEVDVRALGGNIARWMRTGLAGLVVLGSNGEAAQLDDAESDTAIETARQGVPRDRLLLAGTARESTRATIAATRRAAAAGVDAVLVRTPGFFRSQMTSDAFVAHYAAVADASPVPVLLYNFTAVTGVNLQPDAVARLAEHPNIVGMKESSSDVEKVAELVARTPAGFSVLAGSAPTFYASLCVGAVGGVLALACVAPDHCVRLHALVAEGRHAEARELQRRLTPLARLVTTMHGVPGLKAALDLAGYVAGAPRPPLLPAPAPARAAIREALAALDLVPASTT